MAGFLGYNRESNHPVQDSETFLQQALTDCPVLCEYCWKRPSPNLYLTRLDKPETRGQFCCVQYQRLWEWLLDQRSLNRNRTMPDLVPCHSILNLGGESSKQEAPPACQRPSVDPPKAETYTDTDTISYRLSSMVSAKADWTVSPESHTETVSKAKAEVEIYCCGHNQVKFGLHPHQTAAGFQQRNYSSGMKFLTVFPDGSGQVFYPSGCVALVVVVTEANGRVCIVYDDSDVTEQPIRALFQSDGRATCYHSNGSIWLSLGQSGGQHLDKSGARVQKWSWSSHGHLTPLRPLFLSLNKNVGVRVLGQDQVFVSFLCCGQQARFSVGICCVQCQVDCMNRRSTPSIRSEELFLLAGRMGVYLAIEGLRYCSRGLSSHKPFTAKLGVRHHLSVIRKLLDGSNTVEINASSKAFIHRCLRDYL